MSTTIVKDIVNLDSEELWSEIGQLGGCDALEICRGRGDDFKRAYLATLRDARMDATERRARAYRQDADALAEKARQARQDMVDRNRGTVRKTAAQARADMIEWNRSAWQKRETWEPTEGGGCMKVLREQE